MGHNKMYREIEGYEDALYKTSDSIDTLNELYELIQHGESDIKIKQLLNEIEENIQEIKRLI